MSVEDSEGADSEELWREASERERLEAMTSKRRQHQEKTYLEEKHTLQKAREAAGVNLAADVTSQNARLLRYVEFVNSLDTQTEVSYRAATPCSSRSSPFWRSQLVWCFRYRSWRPRTWS